MSPPQFTVLPDPAAVAEATADRFLRAAGQAIDERGVFRVALSGGSTPKQVYPLLVERAGAVDWRRVEFFWGDERAVPPDDPQSNFGVAYQMLIAQLPGVRPDAVHRMPAEADDLKAAARAYESELRLAFAAADDVPPEFDLIWLGMGRDGHTASLFPDSAGLSVTDRWVFGHWCPGVEAWRMTLTFPVLNAARYALFAVTGEDKAEAVAAVRSGSEAPPAGRVRAQVTEWLVDAAAGGEAS